MEESMGMGDSGSWARAIARISPYTFSAIGIAISIGVSVLGAAWGIFYNGKQFDRCCNQNPSYHFQESHQMENLQPGISMPKECKSCEDNNGSSQTSASD